MKKNPPQNRLRASVQSSIKKIEKAKQERPTVVAQTVYVGVLGLMFVLPVVGGAYLGQWFDCKLAGYSFGWTMSFILIGVFVGAVNVYLFVRE